MCRLALYGSLNGEFAPLARTLNQLESSLGGDGNGYYNSAISLDPVKGLDLTTAEVAYDTLGAPGTTLFHTRLCTAGYIEDALNHPFSAGSWTLAHNGHWYGWEHYAIDTESDTETAAELVAQYGPGVLVSPEFSGSGVWILAGDKETLVIKRSGTFVFQYPKTGGFFHASERIRHYKLAHSFPAKRNQCYRIDTAGSVETTRIPRVDLPAVSKKKLQLTLDDWDAYEDYEPTDRETELWNDALNRWYAEDDGWLDEIPRTKWESE